MSENFDVKKLDDFLGLLKSAKDKNSIESYIYIKNILNSIEFPIPTTTYPKGSQFFRTRIHKENEDFFYTVKEISYRKDVQNINLFGRASEPGQSMFYCGDEDFLSFAETSAITRNQIEKSFDYSTTGLWISTEDLVVVSLLTNDDIKGQNKAIDDLSKSFEKIIEEQADESSKVVNNLFQFLSKEFSTPAKGNSNHYKITAAFTNYIFDSVEQVDGILYPSTIYPISGFNFVFQPKTVEQKLKFYTAIKRKMEMVNDKKYAHTEDIQSLMPNNGDKLVWKR